MGQDQRGFPDQALILPEMSADAGHPPPLTAR